MQDALIVTLHKIPKEQVRIQGNVSKSSELHLFFLFLNNQYLYQVHPLTYNFRDLAIKKKKSFSLARNVHQVNQPFLR